MNGRRRAGALGVAVAAVVGLLGYLGSRPPAPPEVAPAGTGRAEVVELAEPERVLGLVFRASGAPGDFEALATELLHAVDWPALQREVAVPILLYDPAARGTVHAALIERGEGRPSGILAGRRIAVIELEAPAAARVRAALEAAGLAPSLLPAADVLPALQRGSHDLALAPFADRAALEAELEGWRR